MRGSAASATADPRANVNAHDLGVLGLDRTTGMPPSKSHDPAEYPAAGRSVPASRANQQAQKSAVIRVIEGGDDSSHGSTAIGQCVVRDLPSGQTAEHEISVTYRYTQNGRLEVANG